MKMFDMPLQAIQKAKNSQKYLNYVYIYMCVCVSSSFPSTTAQIQDSAFWSSDTLETWINFKAEICGAPVSCITAPGTSTVPVDWMMPPAKAVMLPE